MGTTIGEIHWCRLRSRILRDRPLRPDKEGAVEAKCLARQQRNHLIEQAHEVRTEIGI